MPPGEVMTIKDAAKYLEVSERTVSRFISARLFPVTRLGHRTVRIDRGHLERFKNKKTTT